MKRTFAILIVGLMLAGCDTSPKPDPYPHYTIYFPKSQKGWRIEVEYVDDNSKCLVGYFHPMMMPDEYFTLLRYEPHIFYKCFAKDDCTEYSACKRQ